jgi:Holliday junction resolvasome RuvABC endonuclease subunit
LQLSKKLTKIINNNSTTSFAIIQKIINNNSTTSFAIIQKIINNNSTTSFANAHAFGVRININKTMPGLSSIIVGRNKKIKARDWLRFYIFFI